MNASIPGRYGFKRRSEQRQAALNLVWHYSGKIVEQEVARSVPTPPSPDLAWDTLPEGLDPAEGDLDVERTARKRSQVASLAAHCMEMMPQGARVVEFGAGSGHLGLLIAHLRPDSEVVLVEYKDFNAPVAKARAERMGLTNCTVFHGTLADFAATERPFDLAVGLHACGLLTDAILRLAVRRGVAVCVTPCCYGQVAGGREDHERGEGTKGRQTPLSGALSAALTEAGQCDSYAWCAKAADFTAGKGGAFDPSTVGFQTALRCMRTVDADRLWWACERGYSGALGVLEPLGCSPKCCVIRLTPLPADVPRAGAAAPPTAPEQQAH